MNTEAQMSVRKSRRKDLEEILRQSMGRDLSFGMAMEAIRQCEEVSQAAWADILGISKSHLCDIEKGRKSVSAERAAAWARLLGYPECVFVELALQHLVDAAGLRYRVSLKAA